MKVLLVLALVAFALAANPPRPVIGNDFTANVEIIEEHGSHKIKINGTLAEDYTNKRQRIDSVHGHEHPTAVEFLRLFSSQKEYEVEGNPPTHCRTKTLDRQMRPAFNWIANATFSTHECKSAINNGSTGNLWFLKEDGNDLIICVSQQNANLPYWLEEKREGSHDGRHIRFFTFTAGTPNPNKFTVPSVCSNANANNRIKIKVNKKF